jgi:uncharacterized membrane protein YidH (DUF202 family)
MAVRKVDPPPAVRQATKEAWPTSLLAQIDEDIEKLQFKGLLAFPVVVAGGFLMLWTSEWDSHISWIGAAIGLVLFAVGLAYFVEFIKLLIAGELTNGAVATMKGFAMKEWMKVFLAFASILAGISCVKNVRNIEYYFGESVPYGICYCIGIFLMAGGITFFWTRSKFYKGGSDRL